MERRGVCGVASEDTAGVTMAHVRLVHAGVGEPVALACSNDFGAYDIEAGSDKGGLELSVHPIEDGLRRGVGGNGLGEGKEGGLKRKESPFKVLGQGRLPGRRVIVLIPCHPGPIVGDERRWSTGGKVKGYREWVMVRGQVVLVMLGEGGDEVRVVAENQVNDGAGGGGDAGVLARLVVDVEGGGVDPVDQCASAGRWMSGGRLMPGGVVGVEIANDHKGKVGVRVGAATDGGGDEGNDVAVLRVVRRQVRGGEEERFTKVRSDLREKHGGGGWDGRRGLGVEAAVEEFPHRAG